MLEGALIVIIVGVFVLWGMIGNAREKKRWLGLKTFAENHTFPETISFIDKNQFVYQYWQGMLNPYVNILREKYLMYLNRMSRADFERFCIKEHNYNPKPFFEIDLVEVARRRGFGDIALMIRQHDPSTQEWRDERDRLYRERQKMAEEKRRLEELRLAEIANVKDRVDFERFVAGKLKKEGIEVELTKPSGDYGGDVIAKYRGVKFAIQCKFYSDKVGYEAVKDAYAAKGYYNCQRACVVSNVGYTENARKGAGRLRVKLLHHWDIVSYIKSIAVGQSNGLSKRNDFANDKSVAVGKSGVGSNGSFNVKSVVDYERNGAKVIKDFAEVKCGADYGQFIAGQLRKEGVEVKIYNNDHHLPFNCYIIAKVASGMIAIECKFRLGNNDCECSAVREVYEHKLYYDCQWACVVSNAGYTKQARNDAIGVNVELLHHDSIVSYVKSIGDNVQ